MALRRRPSIGLAGGTSDDDEGDGGGGGGEGEGTMRRPSIGAGVVTGKLASGARRMSKTLVDTARRLSGSTGADTSDDNGSEFSDDEDDALANQDASSAMRRTVLLALLLGAVLLLLFEAQGIATSARDAASVPLREDNALSMIRGGNEAEGAAADEGPPAMASAAATAAAAAAAVRPTPPTTVPPNTNLLASHPQYHAVPKEGTVPDDAALAAELANDEAQEQHRKIVALQFRQYASGAPVQFSCKSIGNLHLLGALMAGQSIEVACPAGCEGKLASKPAGRSGQVFDHARLWGNNAVGYFEESLLCIAALHALGHGGVPSPRRNFRFTIVNNMGHGFPANSSHGIQSGAHKAVGQGFVLEAIAPADADEEEQESAVFRGGNSEEADFAAADDAVPPDHPPVVMPPVLSGLVGELRERVETLYDVPIDLADVRFGLSKRAAQQLTHLGDEQIEAMHSFYAPRWGREEL
jgi:hypothetical protein